MIHIRMPHRIDRSCGAFWTSWYRLYWLRFAVQKIIHHDDVMCSIVIWPRGSIAACYSHSSDARVAKDEAEEGKTSVAWRGWDKATDDQPSVSAETLDTRAGLTVTVFVAGPASIRQVNVREDCAEAAHFCRHSSIGSGHEEQPLGDVAVHWGEQPLRTEGAKDGAVRRIVEERSQAALRPT